MKPNIRVGIGYDVHQLASGEDFIIGGIKVPHHSGACGHSDADVLLHAITDAILGALSLGDIGQHFPDTDPNIKGIDSKKIYSHIIKLIQDKGWRIGNIDSTVCLQKPKLKDHLPAMIKIIADLSFVDISDVSVKATTTEKLGFVGREEGVSAYATVLLYQFVD